MVENITINTIDDLIAAQRRLFNGEDINIEQIGDLKRGYSKDCTSISR